MPTNKIKSILSEKKYLWLFIILVIFFAITFIFSWSLILYSNFYVRADLWTPLNLILLLLTSILSALNITVSLYYYGISSKDFGGAESYRKKPTLTPRHLWRGWAYFSQTSKKARGFLAILPTFFTTACPTCAPLFISFWSTTATVWFLYLVNLRFYLIVLSIFILAFSLWKMLNAEETCSTGPNNCFTNKE